MDFLQDDYFSCSVRSENKDEDDLELSQRSLDMIDVFEVQWDSHHSFKTSTSLTESLSQDEFFGEDREGDTKLTPARETNPRITIKNLKASTKQTITSGSCSSINSLSRSETFVNGINLKARTPGTILSPEMSSLLRNELKAGTKKAPKKQTVEWGHT